MDIYKGDQKVSHKEDNSPLTAADIASHKLILESLCELFIDGVHLPVLSEEGSIPDFEQRSLWKSFWLVDPLDGTKEFVKRNGEFTVNIALIENNYPSIGMIYIPVSGKVYFGGKQTGSYRTTAEDTELTDCKSLPLCSNLSPVLRVTGSRSHRSEEFDRWVQAEAERRKYPSVEVVTAGSSLKFCLAAEGLVDVYPRFSPTMEWDIAAGHNPILRIKRGQVVK